MQVIRTTKFAMLRRVVAWVTLAVILVVLGVLADVANAQTKPAVIPDAVKNQGLDVEIVYQGKCPYKGGEMLCIAGVHSSGNYGLMLLYNDNGILVMVVKSTVGGTDELLWTHPDYRL
jgi:hypothetical protein